MTAHRILRRARHKVLRVYEKTSRQYLGGYGDSARFEDVSDGWHVTLEGHIGVKISDTEQPDVLVGDHLIMDIYREERS
jgi:hypothetical protein